MIQQVLNILFAFTVDEYEDLDWDARMRIIMGTAYCLMYMHELNPPIAVSNVTSKDIVLTDDYAAKVGFFFPSLSLDNLTN